MRKRYRPLVAIRLLVVAAAFAIGGLMWSPAQATACDPGVPECIEDVGYLAPRGCTYLGCYSDREFCCWEVPE